MRPSSPVLAVVLACGLSLGAAPLQGRAAEPAKAPAAPMRPTAPALHESAAVDPEAIEALEDMSAYLATLKTFELTATTTRDLVTNSGHRVQVGGTTVYKVQRPNAFQIDLTTDTMQRRFYYDGKQFTIFAPQLGFYATAAAPPTIPATLDALETRYGVEVPLRDIFRWNEAGSNEAENLSAGFLVGPAMINGVMTDHYAFREKDRDWEIWIEQGERPLPRKVVIVDRSDEARPAYTAVLNWNLAASFPAQTFSYAPGPDAKAIHLATLQQ